LTENDRIKLWGKKTKEINKFNDASQDVTVKAKCKAVNAWE
jgi:hypothetical protein